MPKTAHKSFRAVLGLAVLMSPVPCFAHDFWVEPDPFSAATSTAVRVSLRVGHDRDVRTVSLARDRLIRLEAVGPGGAPRVPIVTGSSRRRPPRPAPSQASPGPIGRVYLSDPGVYTLVYHARPAYIELAPDKFRAYLEHEGLEAIVRERRQRKQEDVPGKESYGRSAKALVRIGEKDEGFDQGLGLPIEVTALTSPFSTPKGQPLRFRVEFRQQPLVGARVDLLRLDDLKTSTAARSNAQGIVEFEAPVAGPWMVATTHMTRAGEGVRGDWQSFWGTLTFARPPTPRVSKEAPPSSR